MVDKYIPFNHEKNYFSCINVRTPPPSKKKKKLLTPTLVL